MTLTDQQTDRARALLEDGCSYRETARTLGVGRSRVMAALPGYGWTYREAGSFTAATRWGDHPAPALTIVRRTP